jgi:glutaredoxin
MKKLLLIVAIAIGAWVAFHRGEGAGFSSIGASISGDVTEEELRSLAAGVQTGEVVMYTTTDCPYCAQAKSWLKRYGFEFSECDTEARRDCARELEELGGVGVPYVVVRGHHMKDGFDSDEFVAALRNRQG